ncbi:7286_t:CDS:2, partial [Funneliformis caledonium]
QTTEGSGRLEFQCIKLLIGLNKSAFESYLNEKYFVRLVDVLHIDLKETGCDSFVIVHYNYLGSSKFFNLEKTWYVMKITYKSIVGFHNARRQFMLLVARDSTVSENQFL